MSDPAGGDEPAPDEPSGEGAATADGDAADSPSPEAGEGAERRSGDPSTLDRLGDRVGDPATAAVLLIVVGSLLLRTVHLGRRIFHWDEGRVGYWILRFDATGEFFYRPIIHGPFLPVVNNALFDLIGASDFAARLPVAVVGGLLPLVALLLRDRLRGREQVALALLLAVDPLLVYYGRFMRGDVLVGSFCVAAFALVVYAVDTRRTLPLVGSAALLALGFTAKENALVYLACFLGAGALLLDHRLVRTARRTGSPLDAVVAEAVALARFLDGWTAGSRTRTRIERSVGGRDPGPGYAREAGFLGHLALWVPVGAVGVAATFLAVVVFFYAPRPDLWQALSVASGSAAGAVGDATLSGVWYEATWGAGERFWSTWASGDHSGHPYVPYFHDVAETLVYGSGVLVVLAAIGFLADGYGRERGTRAIVAYATYWGAASLVGYPVATDIQAPWAAVHVVLPLSIPAAVGAAHLGETVRDSIAREDAATAGLAVLVLLAAVGGAAVPNADYWNSATDEDREVLQYAQPSNEYESALRDAALVSEHHGGTDVLFVGTEHPQNGRTIFHVSDESSLRRMPPGGPNWHSRLPTPWYLELANANVTSTPPDARYDGLERDGGMPPVVIARTWDRDELGSRLDGYSERTYDFRLYYVDVVVFIDESELSDARQEDVNSNGAL